jgi:hypothetical protein
VALGRTIWRRAPSDVVKCTVRRSSELELLSATRGDHFGHMVGSRSQSADACWVSTTRAKDSKGALGKTARSPFSTISSLG